MSIATTKRASSLKRQKSSNNNVDTFDPDYKPTPSYESPSTLVFSIMCSLLVTIGLGITEIVFSQNVSNGGCTNSSVVSPQTWFLVDGVTEVYIASIVFLTLFYYSVLRHYATYWMGVYIAALSLTFEFVWGVIIGSIVLWRDNYNYGTCNGSQYFNFFVAILVIKYANILFQMLANLYLNWYMLAHSEDLSNNNKKRPSSSRRQSSKSKNRNSTEV